ncbi:uncharacterized protein LOC111048270 [Nilaparvata lugens]|uniref:uncharacterized protein LOC111048270 n=1 Tax=Nilaparvata lugens TaxID=108931 RepID=UPI000B99508F|nr:uncharacterized protein LOC111048270 [Nilaparvata lugens]
MKMLLPIFIAIVTIFHGAVGMDCTLGNSKNAVDKFIHTCPRPIIDGRDEEFCCYSYEGDVKCCDLPEFVVASTFLLLPYIIAFLVISFIISCVCCLCCPFCCCYKKRSGRVII